MNTDNQQQASARSASDTNDQNPDLHATEDRREVISKLEALSPKFVGMISDFALTQVYDTARLDEHMKEVVAITALISLGSERLQGHLESALEKGMTVEDLSEVIMLASIYVGFPRAIDAMLVLHRVASARSHA